MSNGLTFSNTKLQTYLTCPKLYRHQYVRKITTRSTPFYFVLGRAVHSFLECWYLGGSPADARRKLNAEFDEVDLSLLKPEQVQKLEEDRAVALGMTAAYPKFYKDDHERFKNLMTEKDHEFTVTVQKPIGPLKYRAKLDMLAQDHADDWWICEHKTAGKVDATYTNRIRIDSQVLGQMHVAKDLLGKWPKGVIYNILKKPAIRIRSKESTTAFRKRLTKEYTDVANNRQKSYFTREELIVDSRALDEWFKNTKYVMETLAIKHLHRAKLWPMNTGACSNNYGTCAFLQACLDRRYDRMLYQKREKK